MKKNIYMRFSLFFLSGMKCFLPGRQNVTVIFGIYEAVQI